MSDSEVSRHGAFSVDERALELVEKYGSPLYVYDEATLRRRCREMRSLLPGRNFRVNYSAKANSNIELLRIVLSEDIDVDAMSAGEIALQSKAGFPPERILYIGNNVASDEMQYAVDRGVAVSVDSLAQLKSFGERNPGHDVAVRFNPGVGAGHHEKVVTAGKNTKFGVQVDAVDDVARICADLGLRVVGVNQHIGSLFLEADAYLAGVDRLLAVACRFPGLEFIDLGGGFGVPYQAHEERLDLADLRMRLDAKLGDFLGSYGNPDVLFRVEPGRYIVAECGVLLGTVYSIKQNYGVTYVGTDLGFNVLMRPVLYESYHGVTVVKANANGRPRGSERVTVVGNICESGDIIAADRLLPGIDEGDVIVVDNAGAYSFAMASRYNGRQLPAEVLIGSDGRDRLIRRRESIDDLFTHFV